MSASSELLRAAEENKRAVLALCEDLKASRVYAAKLEGQIADIHQHAILVSGIVPNDCPDREALVEKIQAIGDSDA